MSDDRPDEPASAVNEEQVSAWLDGELDAVEAAVVEEAQRGDASLRRAHAELAAVQEALRSTDVEPRPGALDRIMAAVEAADGEHGVGVEPGVGVESGVEFDGVDGGAVVVLASRRRIPSFAAVAAALVIIAGVVGGLGGPAGSLPAIGDLIAQHEAAATDNSAAADGAMDDMDPMPMDEAMDVVSMPHDMTMRGAFADGDTVHLVYETPGGDALSVFRHTGEADIEELGDGDVSEIPAGAMWATDLDDNHVVVVDGSGYVWVVIGSPGDDMMDDMMDGLPSRETSVGDRLREVADAAVAPFRFWD